MGFFKILIASIIAFFVTRAIGGRAGQEVVPVGPAEPARRRMVRCASCGVYVLKDRALAASGETYFCSRECARR
jgi:hypothetical protein